MIELEKIKVVFFDFDDTLCIYSVHYDVFDKIKANPIISTFNDIGCTINQQMFDFIQLLKDKDIEMHILSATSGKKIQDVKMKWVSKYYGIDMINSCVIHHVDKVTRIKDYCDDNDLHYDEILYVDDMWQNLDRAMEIGIQACSPMEVVNYMNTMY